MPKIGRTHDGQPDGVDWGGGRSRAEQRAFLIESGLDPDMVDAHLDRELDEAVDRWWRRRP
ncbi:MAG: hypothetical protein AB7I38_11705 [Dehalococcoidia bacterium]